MNTDKLNNISIGKASKMIGVSIDTLRRWDKKGKLPSFRHSHSGNRYYSKQGINLFMGNPVATAKQWATASNPSFPDNEHHCQTRDVFQARLETFQYQLTKLVGVEKASLVTAITGEIGNNSFDHNLGNWPDTPGVFFSHTSDKKVVLADRGQGVLTTLGRTDPNLKTHTQALDTAFTKIISGRSSEARGNGLKFVRRIVVSHPFELTFQTGDALLYLSKKENKVNVKNVQEFLQGCFAIIKY